MKRVLKIFILLLLIMGSAEAYEYRMPVNIQYTITPAVLMPGDEALLAIELENGAASYGVGKDAGVGTSAQSALLSTPINRTTLLGTPELKVISNDYSNLGMIGPNDKITIYYKIKASENISSGTYLIGFQVVGGYDIITINREIPVKVDKASVGMARAETATSTFNLNVANPRENTLNAVTISPSAQGIIFSPDEYYIGTMDPDEVFTISFSLESKDSSRPIASPTNLSFVAKFKNGDTWHKSEDYVASYSPPKDNTNQNSYLLYLGGGALILITAGGYLYWRKKKASKLLNNGKGDGKGSS
jgi:LPXTG-motif cell wall-anchored protein